MMRRVQDRENEDSYPHGQELNVTWSTVAVEDYHWVVDGQMSAADHQGDDDCQRWADDDHWGELSREHQNYLRSSCHYDHHDEYKVDLLLVWVKLLK